MKHRWDYETMCQKHQEEKQMKIAQEKMMANEREKREKDIEDRYRNQVGKFDFI